MIKLLEFKGKKYTKLLLSWANDLRINKYFNSSKKSQKQIQKIIDDKKIINFLITKGDKPIGWMFFFLNNDTAEVTITVDYDFQNKGYGYKAMIYAEKVIKKRGVKNILLKVDEKNKKAIALYNKLEYKKKKKLIVMEKSIF